MLKFRFARLEDTDLYYKWANDKDVRKNSFSQQAIPYETHCEWFKSALSNPDFFFYLFMDSFNNYVGQARIEKKENEVIIGISVAPEFRGKGFSKEIIVMAGKDFLKKFPEEEIVAYIKPENSASVRAFQAAGYSAPVKSDFKGVECYRLTFK